MNAIIEEETSCLISSDCNNFLFTDDELLQDGFTTVIEDIEQEGNHMV
jgi:hypothetical protein